MRPRLVKLVRDDIGQFLGDSVVTYEPIRDPHERREALQRKLLEEALEFVLKPTIGELADVFEVVRCLAEYDPAFVSMDAVIDEANAKRAERGGFEARIGMYVNTTAPSRHEAT